MKPTLQKKRSIAHAGRLVAGTSKVKKATNRQKGSAQKAADTLVQLSVTAPPTETRKEEATLELKSGEVVDPSTKIKLQLFPVDEVTRIGLEKDGLNPFLELTLRARKKISSVINHFHTKWGGSNIASLGEPMLLPYQSHLRSSRWTAKDTSITVGDVYTALWVVDRDPDLSLLPNEPTSPPVWKLYKHRLQLGFGLGKRVNKPLYLSSLLFQ